MVASVDSGILQPFRLEPKGSTDDPVTHNSEWKCSTALDILPGLHVCVVYLDARRCGSWQPIYQAHAAMKYHDQRIIVWAFLTLLFVLKVMQINSIMFQIPETQRIRQTQANGIFFLWQRAGVSEHKSCSGDSSSILENSSRQQSIFWTGTVATFTDSSHIKYTMFYNKPKDQKTNEH